MKQNSGAWLLVVGAVLLSGCVATPEVELIDPPDAGNARYAGVVDGVIALRDGRYTGPDSGGARPDVVILDAQMAADIDGDGVSETLALIAHDAGGGGRFTYIAVVSDAAEVAPTRLTGDRVQVMSWAAGGGLIMAQVLQSGDDDASCCPGEIVNLEWRWQAQDAIRGGVIGVARRLSVADIEGGWRLVTLYGKSVDGEISLKLVDAAVTGNAGCNGYFGRVAVTDVPGALTFGPLGMTRMSCGEAVDTVEQRFVTALAGVTGFGFLPGQLLLEGPAGVIAFERSQASVK